MLDGERLELRGASSRKRYGIKEYAIAIGVLVLLAAGAFFLNKFFFTGLGSSKDPRRIDDDDAIESREDMLERFLREDSGESVVTEPVTKPAAVNSIPEPTNELPVQSTQLERLTVLHNTTSEEVGFGNLGCAAHPTSGGLYCQMTKPHGELSQLIAEDRNHHLKDNSSIIRSDIQIEVQTPMTPYFSPSGELIRFVVVEDVVTGRPKLIMKNEAGIERELYVASGSISSLQFKFSENKSEDSLYIMLQDFVNGYCPYSRVMKIDINSFSIIEGRNLYNAFRSGASIVRLPNGKTSIVTGVRLDSGEYITEAFANDTTLWPENLSFRKTLIIPKINSSAPIFYECAKDLSSRPNNVICFANVKNDDVVSTRALLFDFGAEQLIFNKEYNTTFQKPPVVYADEITQTNFLVGLDQQNKLVLHRLNSSCEMESELVLGEGEFADYGIVRDSRGLLDVWALDSEGKEKHFAIGDPDCPYLQTSDSEYTSSYNSRLTLELKNAGEVVGEGVIKIDPFLGYVASDDILARKDPARGILGLLNVVGINELSLTPASGFDGAAIPVQADIVVGNKTLFLQEAFEKKTSPSINNVNIFVAAGGCTNFSKDSIGIFDVKNSASVRIFLNAMKNLGASNDSVALDDLLSGDMLELCHEPQGYPLDDLPAFSAQVCDLSSPPACSDSKAAVVTFYDQMVAPWRYGDEAELRLVNCHKKVTLEPGNNFPLVVARTTAAENLGVIFEFSSITLQYQNGTLIPNGTITSQDRLIANEIQAQLCGDHQAVLLSVTYVDSATNLQTTINVPMRILPAPEAPQVTNAQMVLVDNGRGYLQLSAESEDFTNAEITVSLSANNGACSQSLEGFAQELQTTIESHHEKPIQCQSEWDPTHHMELTANVNNQTVPVAIDSPCGMPAEVGVYGAIFSKTYWPEGWFYYSNDQSRFFHLTPSGVTPVFSDRETRCQGFDSRVTCDESSGNLALVYNGASITDFFSAPDLSLTAHVENSDGTISTCSTKVVNILLTTEQAKIHLGINPEAISAGGVAFLIIYFVIKGGMAAKNIWTLWNKMREYCCGKKKVEPGDLAPPVEYGNPLLYYLKEKADRPRGKQEGDIEAPGVKTTG